MGSIRNSDGIWINTKPFREAALHFQKYGYYCEYPVESPKWFSYWREERRRCIDGYSVSGAKITGNHYFYLNFCPIMKADVKHGKLASKVLGFPDFWDGDYNYFWCREIAKNGIASAVLSNMDANSIYEIEDDAQRIEAEQKLFDALHLLVKIPAEYLRGGYNMVVGKSRRKGYSYKNASIAVNNMYTKPGSLTILNAYERKYLCSNGIFNMVLSYRDFLNANTAWSMPTDVVNKADHIRASYIAYQDGIPIEKGFKSEIVALTCKDNADVNRGKDAVDIFIEEAGAFGSPGLLKRLYAASEDCVKAGSLKTGMITIFGTSGDLSGGTADYYNMFSNPRAYELLPFLNTWDDGSEEQLCGFFHPVNWNYEGFYDGEGNSDYEGAKNAELRDREILLENGAISETIQRRMQEKPLSPMEAFSMVSYNSFPVVELKRQLELVKSMGWQSSRGTPVEFSRSGRTVSAKPILSGKAQPIVSLYNIPDSVVGCPMIYQYPDESKPFGYYKIGYDPVRQDTGTSLAAIIVTQPMAGSGEQVTPVVAEYIGRMELSDDMDRMAEYFADFYRTTIMYENEVVGTKNYFRQRRRLNLLALQPNSVISKNVNSSKVARVYGCHMNAQLKDAGERYIKDWLLTILSYDENGNPIYIYDKIFSIRLLEELIAYQRSGNFDLVSALIMALFQEQEDMYVPDEIETPADERVKKMIKLIDKMYQKNSNSRFLL